MNQVVRPENRREFMNKLVVPYDQQVGNPNSVFSEETKLGQPENNRAIQSYLRNGWIIFEKWPHQLTFIKNK